MAIVHYLSPAKTLSFSIGAELERSMTATEPRLLARSAHMLPALQELDVGALQKLMAISPALAKLNHERFQALGLPLQEDDPSCRRAVFCFDGDAYGGLDAASLSKHELGRLSLGCRILSGYYGLLRPADLIRGHRLEMGRRPKGIAAASLYAFWGADIANQLARDADDVGAEEFLSLASEEYDRAATPQLAAIDSRPAHSTRFESATPAGRKVISFEAKRARGLFARHLAMGSHETIESACETFFSEGWALEKKEPAGNPGSASKWIFLKASRKA